MIPGAHESIAGGFHRAIERAVAHRARAVQIFVKNARGWAARPIEPGEIAAFRDALRASPVEHAFAHASYLINLAAEPGSPLRDKGLSALVDELHRCELLGLSGLVIHPGSHGDPARGVALAARTVDDALAASPGRVEVWLENAAGQGSCLGADLDELGRLLGRIRRSSRVGICFDTCHAFAAGHDLTTEAGYRRTMRRLGEAVGGLSAVRAFHLNDSRKPLGCRVDRHEDVGAGHLGLAPFRFLLADRRFAKVPGVLETPDPERFSSSLATLRRLAPHARGEATRRG